MPALDPSIALYSSKNHWSFFLNSLSHSRSNRLNQEHTHHVMPGLLLVRYTLIYIAIRPDCLHVFKEITHGKFSWLLEDINVLAIHCDSAYCCPAPCFWCINYLCLKICSLCRTIILLIQGLDPFFEELVTIRCIEINFIIKWIQNLACHFFFDFEKVPCGLLLTISLLLSWIPMALSFL